MAVCTQLLFTYKIKLCTDCDLLLLYIYNHLLLSNFLEFNPARAGFSNGSMCCSYAAYSSDDNLQTGCHTSMLYKMYSIRVRAPGLESRNWRCTCGYSSVTCMSVGMLLIFPDLSQQVPRYILAPILSNNGKSRLIRNWEL